MTEQKPKKNPSQASVWLAKFGIKGGGWYQEVKIAVQYAMRSAKFSQAARVWLCLRLHTIPYKSELALKTIRDPATDKLTQIKLTPADVAEETGLTRQDVREGMVELEVEGLAKREPIDGKDLRKGNVELYCWVVPHQPEGKFVAGAGYKLPKDILKATRHFGIRLPADFVPCAEYVSHVRIALADYKKAEKVARETVKKAFFVAPGAPLYKDDRNPRKEGPERKRQGPPPLQESSDTVGPPPAAKAEEEEDGSFETLKARYPEKRIDEAKAKIAFHALSPADRRAANRGIQKYLNSERWQRSLAENDGQYIPQASKWLRERRWESKPDAHIQVGKNGESAFDEALAAMGVTS